MQEGAASRRAVPLTRRFTLVELLVLVALGGITLSIVRPAACRSAGPGASTPASPRAEASDENVKRSAAIAERLQTAPTTWKDGVAAVVLVDVSGSMNDRVRDKDGERQRKIVIARRAAVELVRSFETYARAHPDEPVLLGVYEFSRRDGVPAARPVIPVGRPDAAAAPSRLESMKPRGGTPIGDAMIDARLALDGTGLRRRHLLVLTDGENTDGVSPADVARVMERQDDARRAPLYFVAFDVNADAFAGVREHGGLVLSAKDGGDLAATLDELLNDKILVEAPSPSAPSPKGPGK
jgi:Mg-chelatase subunit ChlD